MKLLTEIKDEVVEVFNEVCGGPGTPGARKGMGVVDKDAGIWTAEDDGFEVAELDWE